MRLVLPELGKSQMIPRQRIHAIENDAAGSPMIAVPGVEVGIRAVRALRDDQSGSPSPDLARDVEPQLPGVLDLPVLVAEELDVRHAKGPGGVLLLLLTDRRQTLRRHRS